MTKGRQWGNYNTIIDHTPHEYIILKCFPYFQCIYVTVLQTKCSFYTTATAVTIIIIELKDLIFTLNKIPCRLRCLWNVIITNDHYIASRVHCRYLLLGFTVIVNGNMTPFNHFSLFGELHKPSSKCSKLEILSLINLSIAR